MLSTTGSQHSNWGSLASFDRLAALVKGERKRRLKGRLKNRFTRCEVADDPVVVSKPRPVKAGNSLEDKTVVTSRLIAAGGVVSKAGVAAKG